MNQSSMSALLNNATLLLALSIIQEVSYWIPGKYNKYRPILSGLMISLICIAIMSMPLTLKDGVIFDTRSILISVTGLTLGSVPTVIITLVAVMYRMYIGGAGMFAGLATILASAIIGRTWRRWVYPKFKKFRQLNIYIMSVVVHAVMLACQLLIPYPDNINVISEIALPVMLIYPIASVLLAMLLIRQQERRDFEDELRESEGKYISYIENSPHAVFIIDGMGNYLEVNKRATQMSGYSKEELLKMNMRQIKEKDYISVSLHHLKMMKQKGTMKAELKNIHKNGTVRWWSVEGTKLGEDRFLIYSTDITDKKKAEQNLVYFIYHDALTGVYNRKYYEEAKMRMDIPDNLPISILIADINGVRLVNEAFGFAQGDHLIQVTANILKSYCREDDVLARIGGDEFALLLPDTDGIEAFELIDEIYEQCEIFNKNCREEFLEINLSIGVDTKKSTNENINETEKKADEHLRSKKLLNSKSVYNNLIASMMSTVYEKSQETEEHAKRLVEMTNKIGQELNLSQKSLGELELFCLLHDIGKVVIDDRILKKDTALTKEEWKEMKRHPEAGYKIARSSPDLAAVAEYILAHHERWDGGGYPRGLKGEEIPLLCRILAVVDAYDAMTNDRFYRKALDKEIAMEEIKKNKWTQFDGQIVDIFEKIMEST
jgi:diguanylate cyclase (GGDEF)-like protein/PAS domain S-box-containing protein